jgi:hypothetical protein
MHNSRLVFSHRVHRTLICPSVCLSRNALPPLRATLPCRHPARRIPRNRTRRDDLAPANTGANASSLVSSRGGAIWLAEWFETLPKAHDHLTDARTINPSVIPLCNMLIHTCNKPCVAGSPIRPCNAARGPFWGWNPFSFFCANVHRTAMSFFQQTDQSATTTHSVYHVYTMHCFVR